MSLKVERHALVELAKGLYGGGLEIEAYLDIAKDSFFKKLMEKCWSDIVRSNPEKNFAGEKESRAKSNMQAKIKTMMKSKSFVFENDLVVIDYFR